MGSRNLDTFAHPSVTPQIGGPGVVAYVPCGVSDTLLANLELRWCSDSYRESAISDCSDAISCRQCGDHIGTGVRHVPVSSLPYTLLVRSTTVRTTCPLAWTAFGVALGYAAYFEIVATILLVLLFRSTGVVTMPHGHIGGLVEMMKLANNASLGDQARGAYFHARRIDAASSA
jgi:hypothetical protein